MTQHQISHRIRAGRPRGNRGTKGNRGRLVLPFPLFLVGICLAVTVAATAIRAFTGAGEGAVATTAERLLGFLDYFAGVFTLLSLTGAVTCGLAATDRRLLGPRGRLSMQAVHRAMSVGALGFLIAHIAVKTAERESDPLTVLLPFAGGATFAVGLGTLATDLLVLTAITGALRGRFADRHRPWLWRPLHCTAYACWPIALAHGLTAGRRAALWVLCAYGTCAALVALALLTRALNTVPRRSALRAHRAHRAPRARARARHTAPPTVPDVADTASWRSLTEGTPFAGTPPWGVPSAAPRQPEGTR